jgi:hypothetical protein
MHAVHIHIPAEHQPFKVHAQAICSCDGALCLVKCDEANHVLSRGHARGGIKRDSRRKIVRIYSNTAVVGNVTMHGRRIWPRPNVGNYTNRTRVPFRLRNQNGTFGGSFAAGNQSRGWEGTFGLEKQSYRDQWPYRYRNESDRAHTHFRVENGTNRTRVPFNRFVCVFVKTFHYHIEEL